MNATCASSVSLLWLTVVVFAFTACADPRLEYAGGGQVSKSTLDAKHLIVNHWATWCTPCRIEIPELNRLSRSLDPDKALVLGYGEDFHTGQQLLDDIQDMGIEFAVLTQDPSELWGYGRSTALPRTAVIAPGGEVIAVLLGPQTEESLREVLEKR